MSFEDAMEQLERDDPIGDIAETFTIVPGSPRSAVAAASTDTGERRADRQIAALVEEFARAHGRAALIDALTSSMVERYGIDDDVTQEQYESHRERLEAIADRAWAEA